MSHDFQDEVSLELGRRVAARLQESPELVEVARRNLDRWSRANADSPSLIHCYKEWRELLALPVDQICEILVAQTDQSRRLRQNSPFAGVVLPAEVWAIKSRFRRHATTPA